MSSVRRHSDVGKAHAIVGRRSSNAAGLHNTKPTRSSQNRREIEMSIQDGEYPEARTETDWVEPTDEDIAALEEELYPRGTSEEDYEEKYNTGYEDYGQDYEDEEEYDRD